MQMHRPHSQQIGVAVTAVMLAIVLLYVTYIVKGKGKESYHYTNLSRSLGLQEVAAPRIS
jgi:hypothetical protein